MNMRSYTIYARPADYPSVAYVVRGWLIEADGPTPTGEVFFADSLREARGFLPKEQTFVRFDRSPDDAPSIVETWL
jgi:hypothetical protein